MTSHIENKGGQVIFGKKYVGDNLQSYMQQRSELADLVVAEQHTMLALSKQEEGFDSRDSPRTVDPI